MPALASCAADRVIVLMKSLLKALLQQHIYRTAIANCIMLPSPTTTACMYQIRCTLILVGSFSTTEI